MQPDGDPIKRAFQISQSGRCSTVEQVIKVLRTEGYSTNAIEGPSLRKQLRELIAAANGGGKPPP